MSTSNKGRPTESKKDFMLRVRLDNETLQKLDDCANKTNTSRSEIVRQGINKVSDEINKK